MGHKKISLSTPLLLGFWEGFVPYKRLQNKAIRKLKTGEQRKGEKRKKERKKQKRGKKFLQKFSKTG